MKIFPVILLSVIMISSGFLINSPAIAAPSDNANDRAKYAFKLPDNAVEISPGAFYIGSVVHEGQIISGIAFFHHRDGHGGGPGGGGPGGEDKDVKCYAHIVKNVKWKNVEDYIVDPSNDAELSVTEVGTNIANAIAEWEDPNGNSSVVLDILGDRVPGEVNRFLIGVDTNDKNEILFGDIAQEGAIAVNILWYLRGGPDRGLVEWDQVYDDADFNWSFTGATGAMDFLNIATHEVGHATGLAHPDNSCTEETMYYQAAFGETKKQTLESGDIAGILDLYT